MKKEYPKIVALSGKKSSGKGECCKFATKFFENKGKSVKVFSFAGPLKKLCIEILGLLPEQVYGTEEQKNSLTRYSWENLPHYMSLCNNISWNNIGSSKKPVAVWPKGLMTARQVLQEVGTGIFRRMYANIWNEALLRDIKKWNGDVALVDDMRFPDEFKALSEAGAIKIRLTRNVKVDGDNHASETSLDSPKFDWNLFDVIINNQDMDIEMQNIHLEHEMSKIEWLK